VSGTTHYNPLTNFVCEIHYLPFLSEHLNYAPCILALYNRTDVGKSIILNTININFDNSAGINVDEPTLE
jgi:hypothetical protein